MRKTFTTLALILLCLGAMDIAVAQILNWSERSGKVQSIARFFEYGRSVPGKLDQWRANPDRRDNLQHVAWMGDMLSASAEAAQSETPGQILRDYGMSFSGNILTQAMAQDPSLRVDAHRGPGAPPNFTFALFEDDAPNRRPGDIVVLTLLASSVPGMAAMSNQTWVFEQPAPFTYPTYLPASPDGLTRIDPLVADFAAYQALPSDPAQQAAWQDQLATHDQFYGIQTFGLTWADHSPLLRLIRRSLAISHIRDTSAALIAPGGYPYETVLMRMLDRFATQTRAAGQHPFVLLVQTRDPQDVDIRATALPALIELNLPYLATADLANPRLPGTFVADGHYTKANDARFAKDLLRRLAPLRN